MDEQHLEALAEFAAGAGHEINNPLAIIGGHAQLLLTQIDDPRQRRSLAVIAAQVKRAYEMIADIRLFARPPKPEFVRFDLYAKIDELVEKQLPEFLPPEITLQWKHDEPSLFLESDPVQITVALLALIRNAVESLGEKGTITLEVKQDQEASPVEIRVSDDGPGIPEEIRGMIFSPFFSGRQAGRGLGFGLPKAWRIARQCGGSLELEGGESSKTCFLLRLPR
ncbi:MAG: HAMP domain-containing histidine kinase [Planctomycetaceae bacterium]|nr:HAMP domain-containing histidine kinase [Planctomycetaceae bacterium]